MGAAALVMAGVANAQCTTTISQVAPGELSGRPIRSIVIQTQGPAPLPSPAGSLGRLRSRTLASTVRRQLLFAAGDTVDTLRIAETLRRLRDDRLFTNVAIAARRCSASYGGGVDSVDLTLSTQDAWTLSPVARTLPPDAIAVGAEDRDFLGTGRTVSFSTLRGRSRTGASFSVGDPWMFGLPVMGAFRMTRFGEVHHLRASLGTHQSSDYDPWTASAVVGSQAQSTPTTSGRLVRVLFVDGLVGRVIRQSASGVTRLILGANIDSAAVARDVAGNGLLTDVRLRRFLGGDMGLSRRTAQYDTVGWLARGRGFIDVPHGLEGDVILGVGEEQTLRVPAGHYDLWTGRMFVPAPGMLAAADLWTSGYIGRGVRANHIDRMSLSGYHVAADGYWGARVMLEQTLHLDPDLRMLSLATTAADPTYPLVPFRYHLSDRSAATSAERSFHLRNIGRASVLDAAVFGAASLRWDAPNPAAGRLGVGAAGLRLRLLSANGVVESTRIDLAFPVASSRPLARRPVLSVSVGPLFDLARLRDGLRRER